jgi:salicylate hydroxylase
MSQPPIAIAGAGIAGLAAALALGQREVVVFEQAKAFSNVGASLQLGPNAVRALQKIDAWDAVEPITWSPPEIHLRDGRSGKLLKRIVLGRTFAQHYGAPYRVALRADLHAALLARVKVRSNVSVRSDSLVTHAMPQGAKLHLTVNGCPEQASVLIAADGIKSRLRESLFPDAKVKSAGTVLHRGQSGLREVSGYDVTCVNVWFCPGGHVVLYPAGRTLRQNIVAITPEGEEPLRYFQAAAPALLNALSTCDTGFTAWPGLYLDPLDVWMKDRVLLVGDAAHGTLPYLAQGAAMALEDAAALRNAIDINRDLVSALSRVEAERKARTRKIHFASASTGKIYHHGGLMRLARNAVLRASPAFVMNRRVGWIYKP